MSRSFGSFRHNYCETLDDATRAMSGDEAMYFYHYKVGVCQRFEPRLAAGLRVLDFGCGPGTLSALLAERWPGCEVTGYDPEPELLTEAAHRHGQAANLTFTREPFAAGVFDLIICANVFHHIPPADRVATCTQLRDGLAPGGGVLFFEHNPHNPVTRRVVQACPFDEDAILLTRRELLRLGAAAGLAVRRSAYIVFFPRRLACLRGLERSLGWLPMGAQYAVLLSHPGR